LRVSANGKRTATATEQRAKGEQYGTEKTAKNRNGKFFLLALPLIFF
tara:strand:+ start:194 stop:334 length:141 start_codon:yes stop_codon:yes gene_type:complete